MAMTIYMTTYIHIYICAYIYILCNNKQTLKTYYLATLDFMLLHNLQAIQMLSYKPQVQTL